MQTIQICPTYRISLLAFLLYNQPRKMLGMLYTTLQQNDCTRLNLVSSLWPCVKVMDYPRWYQNAGYSHVNHHTKFERKQFVCIQMPFSVKGILYEAGLELAFFKMRAAYAHLTKKCVRAAEICVSVYYRSKHEQQQQIQACVQTYSLDQSFPVIAAFVELDSSNY